MTPNAEAIRDICDSILRRVDRAYVADCGLRKEFPTKLWRMWGESGLLAMAMPEEYGGVGGTLSDIVLAFDILNQNAMLLPAAVTNFMSRGPILRFGTEEQRRRYLPPTTTGEEYFSFGITEADAGTNTFKIKTTAIRQENGTFLLNGSKTYQCGFVESTHCLLVARTQPYDPADRTKGISLFILDTKLPGISATEMNLGMYLPEKQYNTFFDNVVLPADSLVGEEGRGLKILFESLNSERLLVAAMNVGQADYVINRAVEYARVRAPFDTPIGAYQSIQHPLARAKTYVEGARTMMYKACESHERGEDIAVEANMVKILSSEAFKMAADIAMTCFGGAGVDVAQDILPFYIAAQNRQVAPVNNQIVLSFIGEKVLGLPRSY